MAAMGPSPGTNRKASNATDKRILANATIRNAEHALLAEDVTDADLLAAAKAFRQARKMWDI
mgnify:CR=1|tara:strand:- start:1170 stop:1355 length:186 start_codon:yes stop_codon:yes gene_type:complete